MLSGLSIRDIVLIDRLDLVLSDGLCVLTGETGAGKSILLDALGLALGRRADAGLVRSGAAQGSVTASFDLPRRHPVREIAAGQGFEIGDELVLRRVIAADGRSRAFVNDDPVSIGLLRRLGDSLVEIHGQHDELGLFDAGVQRRLLDAYGNHAPLKDRVAAAWQACSGAQTRADAAAADIRRAQAELDYLRHVADELETLDPKAGEETELAARRALMQHAEKLIHTLSEAVAALDEQGGVTTRLRLALRSIERIADKAQGRLDVPFAALERALAEANEASAALAAAGSSLGVDPAGLERAEERLFALRAAARKHNVTVEALPALRDEFARRLAAATAGEAGLAELMRAAQDARSAYLALAGQLRAARQTAMARLDRAVATELKPLKLGAARFATRLEPLAEADWGPDGIDRVMFEVATNAGGAPGPLARIASGGELSRFTLALKVVLAAEGAGETLIFDEVDRGIGGATADAVGERLARLARRVQVIVVTHSPQVAARGDHHWRVSKETRRAAGAETTLTRIEPLEESRREEELARMLAGARVTDEARAAAASLLAQAGRR